MAFVFLALGIGCMDPLICSLTTCLSAFSMILDLGLRPKNPKQDNYVIRSPFKTDYETNLFIQNRNCVLDFF